MFQFAAGKEGKKKPSKFKKNKKEMGALSISPLTHTHTRARQAG